MRSLIPVVAADIRLLRSPVGGGIGLVEAHIDPGEGHIVVVVDIRTSSFLMIDFVKQMVFFDRENS